MGEETQIYHEKLIRADQRRSIHRLQESGQWSDCVIFCGDTEYPAHKAIICSRSPFFEAAFSIGMKESQTGIIRLDDDDPFAVSSMIHFFYNNDYLWLRRVDIKDEPEASENEDTNAATDGCPERAALYHEGSSPVTMRLSKKEKNTNLIHHTRVYILAEKYDIKLLKGLALRKFEHECRLWWDDEEFVKAAREIYETAPDHDRCLKDVIIKTIYRNRPVLDKDEVKAVLKETELAFDLVNMFK